MKLRNKKTGEIVEFVGVSMYNGRLFYRLEDENGIFKIEVNSLAELNEDWEDYEEPKEDGLDNIITLVEAYSSNDSVTYPKEIVEKLKAWQRLKDKGFRFNGYDLSGNHYKANFGFDKEAWMTETKPDLDLLFGGEE